MNAESEMAGADGLGGEAKPDALDELAREIGYSDGSDDDETGGVDALIDYKNALEERCRRLEPGFEAAKEIAEFLAEPGDWNGGDVCDVAATALIKAELLTKEQCNN